MQNKIQEFGSTEIKCPVCDTSLRAKDLVKLKDRYCCPHCFGTVSKRKKGKKNGNRT